MRFWRADLTPGPSPLRWRGRILGDDFGDAGERGDDVRLDFVCWDPECSDPDFGQKNFVARFVSFAHVSVEMDAAVDFYGQTVFSTVKVEDEPTDRVLAPELQSLELAVSDCLP